MASTDGTSTEGPLRVVLAGANGRHVASPTSTYQEALDGFATVINVFGGDIARGDMTAHVYAEADYQTQYGNEGEGTR